MTIYYHPRFKEAYKFLPPLVKKKAEQKVDIFRKNPFDVRLRIHKLHGELAHLWSFSVDGKYRILLEFYKKDIVFLDIGDHGIYR